MVEDTLLKTTRDSSDEEDEVEARAQVASGENVRKPGSDVRQGDLVLEKGQVLHASGGEIGTLVFVGKTKVRRIADTLSRNLTAVAAVGDGPSEAGRRSHEHGQ